MDKIAQHLPADSGVRIEQPIQYGHAAESNTVLRSGAASEGRGMMPRDATRAELALSLCVANSDNLCHVILTRMSQILKSYSGCRLSE
jgi:hypothetical protein